MDVVVRGVNVELPGRLQDITHEKLERLDRFTHDLERIEIDYSEIRNPRVAANQLCEATVRLRRHFVKAHASAAEALDALDRVIDKLEHQLVRLKEKRVGRSHPRRRRPESLRVPALDEPEGDGESDTEALVLRTKRFDVKPMTVDEAAVQLDLLGHSFYLFTNVETGNAAVVYRRRDGHLGLIEAAG